MPPRKRLNSKNNNPLPPPPPPQFDPVAFQAGVAAAVAAALSHINPGGSGGGPQPQN